MIIHIFPYVYPSILHKHLFVLVSITLELKAQSYLIFSHQDSAEDCMKIGTIANLVLMKHIEHMTLYDHISTSSDLQTYIKVPVTPNIIVMINRLVVWLIKYQKIV